VKIFCITDARLLSNIKMSAGIKKFKNGIAPSVVGVQTTLSEKMLQLNWSNTSANFPHLRVSNTILIRAATTPIVGWFCVTALETWCSKCTSFCGLLLEMVSGT